ncbi:MAG TPA: hypothetical protein VMU54_15740 [Planctomycetota bacterium]|nr:hypothetical protein [Planctomycetota bacterium]
MTRNNGVFYLRPTVSRITEVDPTRRRIHVKGEVHPGELAERGYARIEEEWVLDLRRPSADRASKGQPPGDGRDDVDPFVEEFRALGRMGYAFAEGGEWSPGELYRKFADLGLLSGDF